MTRPAPDQAAISVARLDLSQFRNYGNLHLETGPGPVVLTGANGSGKTNLLEAISMFMPGRGMRGAGFDVMLNNSAPIAQWAVSALIKEGDEEIRLGTSWTRADDGSTQRQASIDGQMARGISGFGEYLRLIWLTPAMDRIFAGPAGDRRRFLDRIVGASDIDHSSRTNSFEKLMRQRNAILAEPPFDEAWLSIIEQQMAEQAVAIAAARLAVIDVLQGHIDGRKKAGQTNIFPAARLVLDGEVEALLRHNPAVQSEDEYARILHDSRKIDSGAGRTLNGPHRSDLIVYHSEKEMEAKACSTGEQKALLVGLILAQAKMVRSQFRGAMPILLLDEIAAHLDRDRRAGLFDELVATGAQSWLTGTDEIQFEALAGKAQFLTVKNGQID